VVKRAGTQGRAIHFGPSDWGALVGRDSQDRLTKVQWSDYESDESRTVEYRYDLLGRRVAKRVDGGTWRWYFYDGLKVVAEGTGQSDKTYSTLGPGAIGGIICRDENGTKYWYHYDRLGNVVAVTNSSGNAYALYTMDAFGNVLEKGNSGYLYEHTTDPQPYHLTTKEYDPDARLYYFHARWTPRRGGLFREHPCLSRMSILITIAKICRFHTSISMETKVAKFESVSAKCFVIDKRIDV